MTVFPIYRFAFLAYHVVIILVIGALAAGSPSVANSDIQDGTAKIKAVGKARDEHLTHWRAESDQADQTNFAAYSYGSPEFRHSLKLLATNPNAATGKEKSAGADNPAASAVPVATPEQMENQTKTIDPCTKLVIDALPPPADRPKALESVKDRDPELFKQIQAKVTDPRYTGELGNITVSTHDKKGRINGCEFIQNVPYWESGPAVQSLVDVNLELAKRGKKLEADPLNGAGRTLGQEEAIVWRNSGLHAKVGKSNHGFGKAIDFKLDPDPEAKEQPWDDPFVNETLHAHGWRQGDTWGPLKNDLHHWSFVGPGPAKDGPPPSKHRHGHHK
jgi:hypothetical protein